MTKKRSSTRSEADLTERTVLDGQRESQNHPPSKPNNFNIALKEPGGVTTEQDRFMRISPTKSIKEEKHLEADITSKWVATEPTSTYQ